VSEKPAHATPERTVEVALDAHIDGYLRRHHHDHPDNETQARVAVAGLAEGGWLVLPREDVEALVALADDKDSVPASIVVALYGDADEATNPDDVAVEIASGGSSGWIRSSGTTPDYMTAKPDELSR
jgi:hypothetical protein